ncbi:hypothetical protein H2248_009088 [Termitomyces sp. 'cryptogamus']|nr:hypothetical protein H2248_009088 [Termitomyces sp. 'cryptogamus']
MLIQIRWKSVLLREIIDTLLEQDDLLGITASTGISAFNIGGSTLRSWEGIGLGDQDTDRYIGKFFGNKQFKEIRHRWQTVKTLIMDEVSMIDGSLFDKLLGESGIMLSLLGEYSSSFQAISVSCLLFLVIIKTDHRYPLCSHDAVSWDACIGTPFILTRVFRQKDQDILTIYYFLSYPLVQFTNLSI